MDNQDQLETMFQLFGQLAMEREGTDELTGELTRSMPEIRETLRTQQELIERLRDYINELHGRLGLPPLKAGS
jgi:chemotaxis protein histidine kinase CheA